MKTTGYKWNKGRIFDLTGEDAYSWLQGQVTQDVLAISFDKPSCFCFCNLNGHIEGVGLLLKISNGVRIILDVEDTYSFEQRFNNIILEDVKLEKSEQSIILGFGKPPQEGGFFILDAPAWSEWITFNIPQEIDWITELEWQELCLLRKMPLSKIDIKEKTFPIELGPEFNKLYVNYQKGCYIGQEILMRLYTQGNPRKQWRVFKTTVPLTGILDHPDQLKGLEVTCCVKNKLHTYYCGIYVHRNIYSKNSNIFIFDHVNKVIGVSL